MFYLLNDNTALRGWRKLPYAVCDIENRVTRFITEREFTALSMCDGQTPVSELLTPPDIMEVIKIAAEKGDVRECPGGGELRPVQRYRLYPSRYIHTAHWSVTGRCNYKCKHCYMSAPDAKYGELSHAQCMDIIDRFCECGVMNVSLTGGEALVRSDFWEIIDRLLAYGINITTIYSNGKLVTPETLDALDRRRIRPDFSLSFDGVGWHDWLRGVKGAEEIVLNAFRLCRERGFGTTAELCLHRRNKHTLRESINLMASLGVCSVKTNPASLSGAWVENAGEDSLTREELYEIYLDYIPQFFADSAPMEVHLGGFFLAGKGADKYRIPAVKSDGSERAGRMTVCAHARHVMHISADGRVLPCVSLSGVNAQEGFPLITEQGLVSCLNESSYMNFISMQVDQYLEKNAECAGCKYKYVCCAGCRASALETGGDLTGPDRAVCAILRGVYIPRIMEAAQGYECVNYHPGNIKNSNNF